MRKLLSLLVAVALAALLAPSAFAGQVSLDVSIEGRGAVSTVEPGQGCSTDEPFAMVVTCGTWVFGDAETPTSVSVRATTPDEAPGHWAFTGWVGCPGAPPSPDADVCVVGAPDSEPVASSVRAVFRDEVAPTLTSVVMDRPAGFPGIVRFQFTANEYVYFECQLDDAPPTTCPNGMTYWDLAHGPHELTVWPIDGSHNRGEPVVTPFFFDGPPLVVGETPAPTPQIQAPPPALPPLSPLLVARVHGPTTLAAKVSRKGTLTLRGVRLACPAVTAPCKAATAMKGRLAKGRRPVVLARRAFSVRPSSSAVVRLKLTRKAAKALARKRRLKAVAELSVEAPNATTRKDVAVALRAPAAPKKKRRARR